jgi:VanZ family protein
MYVTAVWLALLVAALLIEFMGRFRPRRVSTISRAAAKLATLNSGRTLLILLWVFVGFHLFARYTIPNH